jgi:hypothetical protein
MATLRTLLLALLVVVAATEMPTPEGLITESPRAEHAIAK